MASPPTPTPTPSRPRRTDRAALLARLADPAAPVVDLLVVGGGATGLGVALEAAARGFDVVLLEAGDFARGTSSRATKLVHGGVRYLARGELSLVREALHERAAILRNAPHLASPIGFVMPAYRRWEPWFYGLGLAAYDRLAGRDRLGPTRRLDAAATRRELPGAREQGLRGGVLYWDGQFDDARLAIALARSAADRGAVLLNHVEVDGLLHDAGRVVGATARDRETGAALRVRARAVVNATGVWVDALRGLDARGQGADARPMVSPSQGIHLVVDRGFLPGERALLVPSTADGRVLFAVPWLGRVILGTTDTPRADPSFEPEPFTDEVRFVLREAGRYLARAPRLEDVASAWVGLRPLVRPPDDAAETGRLSREHVVAVSRAGLVTVTGGKWTTYRAMAEDVLEHATAAGLLARRPPAGTASLRLAGAPAEGEPTVPVSAPPGPHLYGADAETLAVLPGADRELDPGLSEAMVRFAARHEWARRVEDVLARRSRLLFLDARRAAAVAPQVASILFEETGIDPDLAGFEALARRYASPPA
ncbi:MAG: glycerol-3-phosphate dehydrogenase/oxidase [Burkholderiales bacterium]|jgi:glycerol-3-phosphate dehydrogenase